MAPPFPFTDIRAVLTQPDGPPDWAVPGLLCRGDVMVLAGEPGVGKSYLSYYLSLAMAMGRSVGLGGFQAVRPLRVLYVDEENSQPHHRAYLRWAAAALEASPDALAGQFFHASFTIGHQEPWHLTLGRALEESCAEFVVLDTATPVCGIRDENDNGEASRAIEYLRALTRGARRSVLVLRHARLDHAFGGYKPRGASTWVGSTDGTLLHTRAPGRPTASAWSPTLLRAMKVRAYGLRDAVKITPEPLAGGGARLRFTRVVGNDSEARDVPGAEA